MEVLVRPNEPNSEELGTEVAYHVNVTSETELKARREALSQAWFNGYLVSKFLSISKKSIA
jgi:hypothetical protein